MTDTTRVLEVLNADYGKFQERELRVPEMSTAFDEARIPYPRDSRGNMTVDHERVALMEAELSIANFPDLLRQGIQFDAFSSYNEMPVTYPQFCDVVNSSKQQEEYLKDASFGLLPVVAEGAEYPEANPNLGDGVIIRNHKRGVIMSVSEEMQKFDNLGKVRDIAFEMGWSARMTEEQATMDALTTTSNYTRTNAAGDDDEAAVGGGANFQAVTFSTTGLITAFNILTTMKDRRSGKYLNVMPDTLIVAPKLLWAAKQLIQSPVAVRAGGSSTNEVYGGGQANQFFDIVRTIIVSPQFDNSYGWALLQAKRALKFQRVESVQILQEGMNAGSHTYMERDVIRYRVRTWFGVGMKDDRFAFLSTSTTAPTIG